MKKTIVMILSLIIITITGCGNTNIETIAPDNYPDSPENERHESLSIYMAWDGAGGETWDYELSVTGIIEEGGQPPSAPDGVYEDEDGFLTLDADFDPPGGRSIWFKGVRPGDVVVTFTIINDQEKIVDIQQYTIRVYDDLRLSLLHSESESYRN